MKARGMILAHAKLLIPPTMFSVKRVGGCRSFIVGNGFVLVVVVVAYASSQDQVKT